MTHLKEHLPLFASHHIVRIGIFIYVCLLFLLLASCGASEEDTLRVAEGNRYAQGFTLSHTEGKDSSAYLFRSKMRCRFGDTLLLSDTLLVLPQTPKRIVCLSSTQIPYLKALGKLKNIVGIAGTRYISDSVLQEGIANGNIAEVGLLPNLDYERLLNLAPDLILGYDADFTALTNYAHRLRAFKIPVISIDEYHENHPLGRAEWLKFFAFIFRRDSVATAILDTVNEAYERISYSATKSHVPTVLINYPWKGIWYIPTQESYMAQFVRDAGGRLLLSSQAANGNTATTVSLDEVLSRGFNAEYWLNPSEIESLEALSNYENFRAVRNRKVYNNTRRTNTNGGNDFYESGVLLPHFILRDVYTILHSSEQDSCAGLYFYKKLE